MTRCFLLRATFLSALVIVSTAALATGQIKPGRDPNQADRRGVHPRRFVSTRLRPTSIRL